MKKLLVLLFVTFCSTVFLGMANIAEAGCGQYGKVRYAYQYASGSTYFYISPRTTTPASTYYYYFRVDATTNGGVALVSSLASAQASGQTVYVYGNASACPTTGTGRYGGTVSMARVHSDY
nr:hypothetical protein [uncultured Desulfobulbus sp.]